MDQQEGLATNRTPLFTGENYAYWSVRMKFHLISFGWKVSATTEKEFKIKDNLSKYILELDQYEGNAKSLKSHLEWTEKLCIYKGHAMQDYQTSLG